MGMQKKLTKRIVDAARPEARDTFFWDTETQGFGLKVTPSGNRIYVLQARLNGRPTRYTIGKHGAPWTPDSARDQAVRKLGDIAKGINPNAERTEERNAATINELCDLYLEEGYSQKKASTLAIERGMILRHIKPLLGKRRVKDLTRAHIEIFLSDVANGKTAKVDKGENPRGRIVVTGGKGTANRSTDLLGAMLTFAMHRNMRPDNPVRGAKKYKLQARERFLSPKELARLGGGLTAAESEYRQVAERAARGEKQKSGRKGEADPPSGENPFAVAALKLLLLTGCRKNEILSLQWQHVDFERACLRLPDSKTGAKVVHLGPPALEIFSKLERLEGNSHVFPSTSGTGHFVGLYKVWKRIREKAELPDVRIHDLRHSFASVGVASGDSLYIVGKLLGHTQARTTQRYAHLADDPIRAAADRISSQIADALDGQSTGEVVEISTPRKG